jgi:hypothetical protein
VKRGSLNIMRFFPPNLLLCLSLSLVACAQKPDVASLKAAVRGGDAKAALTLGHMYEMGDGVCRSIDLAYGYYGKAAMRSPPYRGAMDAWSRAAKLKSTSGGDYNLIRNVASLAARLLEQERSWRQDVQLMRVEIQPTQDNIVTFELESPSTREGEWAFFSCDANGMGLKAAGKVAWGDAPLPDKFMDIGEAIAAAESLGLKGRTEGAILSMHTGKGVHRPVWDIAQAHNTADYWIDPLTGRRLKPSDVDDPDPLYEQFAKTMAAAAAARRAATLQQAAGQQSTADQRAAHMNDMYRGLIVWQATHPGQHF